VKNGVFISISYLILFIVSCDNPSDSSTALTKELDIASFTVRTPDDWDWQQDQGHDTFIGRISNGTETIFFDMGYLSFGGLEYVDKDERTISFQNVKIDGIPSIIVKERTSDKEISRDIRLSVYIDVGDGQLLNRLYVYDPQDEVLIKRIFRSHKFK